ncbi:phage tail protein [Actinokineospora bangkokensis]|uniref:LysM domain-containing protein n=1 Tax=Actinokineospora bangkokensis TaxID=1193682 RepID=A0A1Q9LLF5_9PSEU|nr:phage tail protein [Actinokineospora bangkokensis]OLR92866.1 hypothetical protein BJP25_19265 [Actinokineospora bangkokensis]
MIAPMQALMNGPAALGALSSSLKGAGSAPTAPGYGLTMWFQVKVSGVTGTQDLGKWSGCSAVQANFGTETINPGGSYGGPVLVPGRITYPDITLERAMDKAGAEEVRTWLRSVAKDWIGGAQAGKDYPGATVTITVYSALPSDPSAAGRNVVAEWVLTGAVPVSWTAPALSGKGGAVAVEKLTLAHRGFLGEDGGEATGTSGGQARLTLTLLDDSGNPAGADLEFAYNPAEVSVSKSSPLLTVHTLPEGHEGPQLRHVERGDLNINIDDLHLVGQQEVATTVGKVWAWLDPQAKDIGAGTGKETSKLLGRKVRIRLGGTGRGDGVNHDAALTHAHVTYTRFSAAGVPTRAKVRLTLQEVVEALPGTNPHSGGLPGGHTRTVTGAENLAGITAAELGSPARWREVADANGIDDPLRVRPGRALRLPGA